MLVFNCGGRCGLSPKLNLIFQCVAHGKWLVLAIWYNLNGTASLVSELECSLVDVGMRLF